MPALNIARAVCGLVARLDEDETGGDEHGGEGVEGGVESRDVVERHGSVPRL